MIKKKFIRLLIAALIVAVFASGCAQEANIQVTFIPAKTPEPTRTEIPLPSGEITDKTFTVDVDNNDIEETITFDSMEIEHDDGGIGYLTVMTISGDSGTYTENIEGCLYASCYFIRVPGGEVCLLVSLEDFVGYDSGIYSFDGIKPVELYDLGHITGVFGTDITEEGPIDVFGTWHYSRTIKLNDDLSLEYGEYQIVMDDKAPLHIIKEIPVEFLKNGIYTKDHVDKGKDILPVSTDGISYLKFRLEDGTEGRMLYTYAKNHDAYDESDGQYTVCLINSNSEYEFFENIEYTDQVY